MSYDPSGGVFTDFAPSNYPTQDAGFINPTANMDFNMPTLDGEEPPLLEELGINFTHIYHKTVAVLTPFKRLRTDLHINDDDLAGPLFFALLFGSFLLLVRLLHNAK